MIADPSRLFVALYCGTLALQTLLRYQEQLRFFRTVPAHVYGAPPKFLGLIPLAVPGERVFSLAGAAFILSLGGAAAGVLQRLCLLIAIFSFLVYFPPILSLTYIRRKANLIPIVLAIMLAFPERNLLLVQIAVTMVFFSAGIEKLRTSGIRWADGIPFRGYLVRKHLLNDIPYARAVAGYPRLCRWLSLSTLVWELTFWLVPVIPSLVWVYLPAAILFHLGTSILMRVHYWIYFGPVYFAFMVPWVCSRS